MLLRFAYLRILYARTLNSSSETFHFKFLKLFGNLITLALLKDGKVLTAVFVNRKFYSTHLNFSAIFMMAFLFGCYCLISFNHYESMMYN